jgi:hypothetical protein
MPVIFSGAGLKLAIIRLQSKVKTPLATELRITLKNFRSFGESFVIFLGALFALIAK